MFKFAAAETALLAGLLVTTAWAQNPQSGKLAAPEFEGVTEWVNSEPLKLANLRGKVVLVHFWAFGCSNCIHDHDKYLRWNEQFSKRGVVLVGIHTPETSAEHEVENVKRKVAEVGFKHPIVIDNDAALWKAWRNRLWPSMYLIDKNGDARYAWEGELTWEGAKGPEIMTQKIEELLAEKPSTSAKSRAPKN
jgi:thiol-disulfide isomerase/thioredoxin